MTSKGHPTLEYMTEYRCKLRYFKSDANKWEQLFDVANSEITCMPPKQALMWEAKYELCFPNINLESITIASKGS